MKNKICITVSLISYSVRYFFLCFLISNYCPKGILLIQSSCTVFQNRNKWIKCIKWIQTNMVFKGNSSVKEHRQKKIHGPIFFITLKDKQAMELPKSWVRTLNTQRLNRNSSNMQISICVVMCNVTQSGLGLLQRDKENVCRGIKYLGISEERKSHGQRERTQRRNQESEIGT